MQASGEHAGGGRDWVRLAGANEEYTFLLGDEAIRRREVHVQVEHDSE